MNHKEEYRTLLKTIKGRLKSNNKPATNEAVAKVLDYSYDYFRQLIGKGGKIDESHIKFLKLSFSELLENRTFDDEEIDYEKSYLLEMQQQVSWLRSLVKDDIKKMKASLATMLGNQDQGLTALMEILWLSAHLKGLSSPGKHKKSLDEIARRIGPPLDAILIKGKTDDDDSAGKGKPE